MRGNWVESALGHAPMQIIDGDRGKAYPKHGDFSVDGHCLFLSATNVTASGFHFSDCQFISEKKDDELRKGKLARNDVVLTTRGTLGNSAYYGNGIDFDHVRINSGMVIMRTDQTKLLPEFLYGYLRSPSFESQVEQLRSGVAQPQLPIRDLSKIKMPLPPIDIQRKIVGVFSSYDDLIENNRRRMVLLEDSARQLYREWFIRLRFPGHEHTRITDGVPEGWEKAKVGTLLAKVVKGKKIQRNDYLASGQIPCIDQGADFIGGYTDDEEARIVNPLPLVVFGDHTRIFKFVSFPFAIGADGTQLICPNTPRISPEYFYFALKAIDLSNYFYARHFKFLKEEGILIPVESLVREFSKFAGANFEQINYLRTQNQKLRAARDLLLPRLMSGEIAV